ncbi:MAG: hypothetical protein OEM82_02730 [Acidobacteriota bacterium]|nr:hypothetical protein [Acidobacteriota bacterium]
MSDNFKLAIVKTIHTVIWIFFNVVLAYLFYAAYTNRVGFWFWMGVALIGLECLILLLNGWTCPLSPIARRYTDSTSDNFDIYIPVWLAKHNKLIYTILVAILIAVYLVRVE